jgi:hypothetical protein
MNVFWLSEPRLIIQRSNVERSWVTETDRAAYKCKPMRDASATGWQILMPCDISLKWDGGSNTNSIHIECADSDFKFFAVSHFKFGLVSFVVNAIFRTQPGIDVFICGPVNSSKRGITPLSARIETDWLPFHFAMTWRITEPNLNIVFERGEPFAQFYEIERRQTSGTELEQNSITDNPTLLEKYSSYLAARQADARAYEENPTPRRPLGFYDRGEYPNGSTAVDLNRRPIEPGDS